MAPLSRSVRSPTRVDVSHPAPLSRSAESPGRMNLTRKYGPSNKSTRIDRIPEALSRYLAASQASAAKHHTPRSVAQVYDSLCPMQCERVQPPPPVTISQ
ncbi:hypothetical protein J437_LFUL007226 [Ladona fulva]|uniref:Uncharacterized protein n=1 Tax=Ladona fulva TaxID=123851 RepID=A0A8K0K5E2_LADFU|nr:hypothetical protein J437_LFUL007226 [Ladona fulva]